MKKFKIILMLMYAAVGFGVVSCTDNNNATDDEPETTVKCVGTYDSRVVAYAYWWDDGRLNRYTDSLAENIKKANAAGDDKHAKELEAELWAFRKRLHRQVFGAAPIDDVLEGMKGKLPEIMERADVTALVSKWDKKVLKYYKSAEMVDVTDIFVKQFKLDDKRLKTIKELKTKPPVPLAKLDEMMEKEGR
ncbi:MAG: hypothetical protein KAR11_01365 [Phycisphaerae bacterium]|nr:hypothetical protein [Phycisphaerae bacterium]